MTMRIRNRDVERLACDVAELAGETRTKALKIALAEEKVRLLAKAGWPESQELLRYLERYVWPARSSD
jgi:antitoxin VapB